MNDYLIYLFAGILLAIIYGGLAYFWPRRPFDRKNQDQVLEYGRKAAERIRREGK